MPAPIHAALSLTVDPGAGTVQPSYAVTTDGVKAATTALGGPEPIPSTWLSASTGLAVGILSTSAGPAPPFPATWDLIEVVDGDAAPPATDTTAPTVTGVAPQAGATGVSASTNVSATFSEPLDSGTVSSSTFTLVKEGMTSPVAAVVSYNSASNTAVLDPNTDLEAGKTYTATVKGGASGVKDVAGNPLAADKVWSFTVDATAPSITAVSPKEGATGVNAAAKVTATFSESIAPSTVNSTTFTLVKDGTTSAVAAVVTYDSTTKTASLNPSARLEAGKSYTATVRGGPSGVKDLAGNPLAADKVWSFTVRLR